MYHPSTNPLQALYHLAVELSAQHSLNSVLQTALHQCLELTDSQFGFIGLCATETGWMDVAAIHGFHPTPDFYKHNHRFPLRPNVFANAVLENRPVRSNDARIDPVRVGQPQGHPPVKTFLGVPLRLRDEPIGMIGLANRPDPYDDDHEQLLMTYAAQVAIVIGNAQLYEALQASKQELERKVDHRTRQLRAAKEALAIKAEQLQQLLTETVDVQERERKRIAQGMHDGINQLLIGAMLELKSAQARLDKAEIEKVGDSVTSVQKILHRVEREMRHIVHDLRPPTLDELGLVPAFRRYAERYQQYTNISCAVRVLGKPTRFYDRMEINIYRLMQEALQNISTHAQATDSNIVMVFSPKTLKLSVSDNGVGFDVAGILANRNGGMGLMGMRERAESIGGQIDIYSEKNVGTRVTLTVPIEPSKNGQ